MTYQVVAIAGNISKQVRATLAAPQYGHPAHVEIAKGYGPCRSCLRTFRTGAEARILFTYNPFAGLDPYPLPGPVFIHHEDCVRYEEPGFPKDLLSLPLMLEGYGRGRRLVAAERVEHGEADSAICRLFAHAAIDYIHVRNLEAGCFIAHIERAG